MAFTVTDQGSVNNSSGATLARTVPTTIAIGSLVVVAVNERNVSGGGAAGTLADSASNSYTKANTKSPNNTTADGTGSIWYCLKTTGTLTGGSSTITYTKQTSGVVTGLGVISATYATSTIILDKNSTPTTGSSTTPSISATGTSGTELYVAGMAVFDGGGGGGSTFTQASGWSNGPDDTVVGINGFHLTGGNKLASGAQTWNPSLSAAKAWAAFLLVFQEVVASKLFRPAKMDGVSTGGPFFGDPLA